MKKILTILIGVGLILLGSGTVGSAPPGGVKFWVVGSPDWSSGGSGPSPVLFKLNAADGSIGTTFTFASQNWMQIRAVADNGNFLYVSHNVYSTDSAVRNNFRIAKLHRTTGAILQDVSIAGYISGQTFSQIIALAFQAGRLYGIEHADSGTPSGRGSTVEILLDGSGDVTGATRLGYVDSNTDGALTFYNGEWYASVMGNAEGGVSGSKVFKSPAINQNFTQLGTGDCGVRGIGYIDGWEFDGTGRLLAVSRGSGPNSKAFYLIDNVENDDRAATVLFDLSGQLQMYPLITRLNGLSRVVDRTPPVVTVPADMRVESAVPVMVTFNASAVDDEDGFLTPICNPASGSSFPVGENTVVCTATDSSGNRGSNSFTILIYHAPSAPTNVRAVAGDEQATVSFNPPANTGGAPITGYRVTSNPGNKTAQGASSPISVTGLTNGTAYTFTVTATNSQGLVSPPSQPSNSVTPQRALPDAPGIWAVAGDERATVYFNTPWTPVGTTITSYTITVRSGGGVVRTIDNVTGSPIEVTNLVNGTTYNFTVTATNNLGRMSLSSFPSNSVTPEAAVPSAPGVWAKAGDASAEVFFSTARTPAGTITGYTVTCNPACGAGFSGTSSPIRVTGLTNGTNYTFTVRATNSLGRTGPPSFPSNMVMPLAAVPSAPSGVWATAGDGNAKVYFTHQGGSGITYTATSHPDGKTGTGASPITVTGLTNGTTYTFTVTATNSQGTSLPSLPSNSVTPRDALPDAPGGVWAKAGNASATVTFAAPWYTGEGTITSYRVTCNPACGTGFTGNSSPITVTGLTNGITYTFTVTATNSSGKTSISSLPSNSVTPAADVADVMPEVLIAPAGVWAKGGDEQATVYFSSLWSPLGRTIYYTVTSNPGNIKVEGVGSPITVKGLKNDTSYTFTVTATLKLLNGEERTTQPSLPSNSVTPKEPSPDPPSAVWAQAGDESATVIFTPPSNTGKGLISYYTVTSNPGNIKVDGVGSPITVTGLTNGTTYTFTVTATNSRDKTSISSLPSNQVTPTPLRPDPPAAVGARAGDRSAVVTFTPSSNTGGAPIDYYRVTSSSGNITAEGAGSPITVEGLTNGTNYTFTVTAINKLGRESFPSLPSNIVTPEVLGSVSEPTDVPPPEKVWAEPGNEMATVHFSSVWTPLGPVSSYTVTSNPDGKTATGFGTPIVVTGLTNGRSYTFTVTATVTKPNNEQVTSGPSLPSPSVTPRAP